MVKATQKTKYAFMELLSRVAAIAVAITLGVIFISILVFKQAEPVGKSLLACLAFGVVIAGAALLLKRASLFKRLAAVIWAAAALYFAILITLSLYMRYTPVWDMSALFNGAVNWGVGDGITSLNEATFDAATYYYYFPNNLGSAGALAIWFKLCSLVGFTDYLYAGFILCALLLALSFAGTAFAAKELAGNRASIVAMLLFALTLPFLFAAHMFYTDFLSMPFGVLGAYFIIKASAEKRVKKRWICLAASALSTAIGIQLKATVLIAVIAAIICIVLKKDWRLLWKYSALAIGAAAAAVLLLNLAVYGKQLDRQKADEMNTPALHWVMMGVNGATRGVYSANDYTFTRSFPDPNERDAAIKQEIGLRLKKNGFDGTLKLVLQKWAFMYGDGTASVGDFMPMPKAAAGGDGYTYNIKHDIYDFVNAKGKDYTTYKAFSNGMRLLCILLAFGFALLLSIRGVADPMQLIPLLMVFGLALFLSFWESNDRYVVNMLPLLITAAACGAEALASAAQKSKRRPNPSKRQNKSFKR